MESSLAGPPQGVLTACIVQARICTDALECQGGGSQRRALLPRPCREPELDPNWGQIPFSSL